MLETRFSDFLTFCIYREREGGRERECVCERERERKKEKDLQEKHACCRTEGKNRNVGKSAYFDLLHKKRKKHKRRSICNFTF